MNNMIVIQNFPTVASLAGWLNNARIRQGKRNFAEWLAEYLTNRELTVNGYEYRYRDCVNLVREEFGT